MMRKLVRVVPPESEHSLYRLYFDYGDGKEIPCDMTVEHFKVFEFEQSLLVRFSRYGLTQQDLDKYKDLLREFLDSERYQ